MGGPNGITLFAWLLLSPISIFFTYAVVPEGYLPQASPILGLVVGLIGHLVTGGVLFLAKFTILRDVANKPKPFNTLTVFAVAGASRGFSVSHFLEQFEITESANYQDRIVAGAILVLVWFAVVSVMVDGSRTYRRSFAQLSAQLESQLLLKQSGAERLEATQAQLLGEVRQTLSQALRTGMTSGQIHAAVDELVRPLAHQLSAGRPPQAELVVPRRRRGLGPVVRTALSDTAFSIPWVVALAVLPTVYTRVWQAGWIGALDSVLTAATIAVVFSLAKRLKIRGPLVIPVWFLTGLASASLTAWLGGNFGPESVAGLLYLAVNVLIPAAIIAFIGAFDREANANLDRLRGVITLIQWQTANLQQREWVQRQRIARFVHSELQSRLRAFALRMDFAGRLPRAEEIEELRADCERSLLSESRQTTLSDFAADLGELWSGVAEIELQSAPEVLDALNADPYCTAALIEVIREAVSNAVRHGGANKILIELEFQPGSMLGVRVTDNGSGLSSGLPGMGMRTIGELSSNYSLESTESGAQLRASLPLARVSAAAF